MLWGKERTKITRTIWILLGDNHKLSFLFTSFCEIPKKNPNFSVLGYKMLSKYVPGVSKKKKRLIDHTTKYFRIIIKFLLISIENNQTLILSPSLLKSDTNRPKYVNFKTDKLISTYRNLPIFGVLIFTSCVH